MFEEAKLLTCILVLVGFVVLIVRYPALRSLLARFVNSPTAKCHDGSLSYSDHPRGTCSHHGGVHRWFEPVSA
jgi:hypothetical protein